MPVAYTRALKKWDWAKLHFPGFCFEILERICVIGKMSVRRSVTFTPEILSS